MPARNFVEVPYAHVRALPGVSYAEARARITEELGARGFGVLSEIDVKETLKRKIDADFRPYVILGACNPSFAHRALSIEPQIGILLPCNVVVQETEEGAIVSTLDPRAMFETIDNPELEAVMREVDENLREALQAIA